MLKSFQINMGLDPQLRCPIARALCLYLSNSQYFGPIELCNFAIKQDRCMQLVDWTTRQTSPIIISRLNTLLTLRMTLIVLVTNLAGIMRVIQ